MRDAVTVLRERWVRGALGIGGKYSGIVNLQRNQWIRHNAHRRLCEMTIASNARKVAHQLQWIRVCQRGHATEGRDERMTRGVQRAKKK